MAQKLVNIKGNGRVRDTDARKSLSMSNPDTVTWSDPNGGGSFTIVFDKPEGSPFLNSVAFTVPNAGSIDSGPIDPNAVVGQSYRYSVYKGNQKKDDPDVIIQP